MDRGTGGTAGRIRHRLRVEGVVQGVGFRPFVHGLAGRLGLGGLVGNDAHGVFVEVEGDPVAVTAFEFAVTAEAPPLAVVEQVTAEPVPARGETTFGIAASRGGGTARTLVSPDTAPCTDCLRELSDPGDRRHRYPFVNCTNCGPRFTIVRGVPYDRPLTTMAGFPMCERCAREYHDPADRRFHAQPTCCPACGPHARLVDPDGHDLTAGGDQGRTPAMRRPAAGPDTDRPGPPGAPPAIPPGDPAAAVVATAGLLRAGRIVGVKGLGGYHLAVDAGDEAAVARLRARKHREEKPLALMVADLDTARALVHVDETEAAVLGGIRAPIVLLRRRDRTQLAPSVAPGNPWLGVMLPSTPLHHLLAREVGRPLVLTSGNVSDEPIAYRDGDAARCLAGIADALLVHDRPIQTRTDDSVVRVWRGAELPVRRARGYAPQPLPLRPAAPRPVLGCGAELKHTFCLARGGHAFVSHHIGDLENTETLRALAEGVDHYRHLFDTEPAVVAHDLHPEYLSTKWALGHLPAFLPPWMRQPDGRAHPGQRRDGQDQPVPRTAGDGTVIRTGAQDEAVQRALRASTCAGDGTVVLTGVQHHHAHVASCLAEHGEEGPVVGVALDGLGYGTDGTLWGGELLVADLTGFERAGHLATVRMPGGAAAIRQPWRMAAAHLDAAFGGEIPPGLAVAARHADRWDAVTRLARTGRHAPVTSSAGRLFDAVSALLGVRNTITYEGQAAIELERLAARHLASAGGADAYPARVTAGTPDTWASSPGSRGRSSSRTTTGERDTRHHGSTGGADTRPDGARLRLEGGDLVRAVVDDMRTGADPGLVAARFHHGLAALVAAGVEAVRARTGLGTVALSGGVLQNVVLLDALVDRLEAGGARVLTHRRVPPGDGGISLGQAAVAAARDRRGLLD